MSKCHDFEPPKVPAQAGPIRIWVRDFDLGEQRGSGYNLVETSCLGSERRHWSEVGMKRATWAFLVVLVFSGCLSLQDFEFPKPMPRHPAVEKQQFRIHDPFGDNNLGPSLNSRPLGFERQRTEPRRIKEVHAEYGWFSNLRAPFQRRQRLGAFPNVVRP